ncbi:PfkB family carbohydrate kinase [Actinocrispum sp. NPDC049592]|uniref:PfkB family carbohydrate kinase n=1 Tax=Actinocrispum sp. NPDC049592 TaxID=3154835 RepID=UPI003441701E
MTVVVVGDCLLDIDIVGSTSRLCPDAPAPVVDIDQEHARPGGAGLAAALLAADGVPVRLVTAIADDQDGRRLREVLGGMDLVAGPSGAATPVKIRLRSSGQSLARMDRGSCGQAPAVTEEMIDALWSADAVLVADYGRGLVRDRSLRKALSRLAHRIPVVWDPHPRGPDPVAGVWLATPNASEAKSAAGVDDPYRAASLLRDRWSVAAVAVTAGSQGAILDAGGLPVAVPAPRVPVLDPCGAGDKFAGTVTSRLGDGDSTVDAVRHGVLAASRFLANGGAAAFGAGAPALLRPGEDDARAVIATVRSRGGTVVATGGCFDLVHAGHTRTLAAARALGDCLVVCMNSDRSVRRLKGPDRPLMSEQDRVELLMSLECVDAVAVFDEDDPLAVLDDLRPDVWVKGGDYREDELPEARLVRSWGGRTVLVPYHPGRSTSRLADALGKVG